MYANQSIAPPVRLSQCQHCGWTAIWIDGVLSHPAFSTAPMPHDDLVGVALETYLEARSIVAPSPRASSALLRRCLEELVGQLGARGSNLNDKVGDLVASGMSVQIQQAMDTLRVIGNESVHPGTIDVRDDPEVAIALFELVNLVVEAMITQPQRVAGLYERLPESKRKSIDDRDGGK